MIINLKKYLFIGAKEDLADFFIQAQEAGFIEFIFKKQKNSKEVPEPLKKLIDVLKILRKQPLKEPYLKGGDLAFAEEVADQVLELAREIEKLSEEKRFLEAEIVRVAPFGNFSFEDIEYIEKTAEKKIQFYCVKSTKHLEQNTPPNLFYIGTDYDLDYFLGINQVPTHYADMIEMHFDRTAGELKNHLAFVEETLYQVEAELKGFAGHIDFLRDALAQKFDHYALEKTQKSVDFPISGSIFCIEGWVPENKIQLLPSLIEGKAIFFEPIAIEKEDFVPTCMENKGMAQLGEDLVKIYDVPAASDKDPSPWVIWAFALFFAMIIADGGYGLIYLGLALFLKVKFPDLKGGAKRLLKMFFLLSISCIVWGVLTSSFFGIQLGPKNVLLKFSLLSYLSEKKAEYHFERKDAVYDEWVAEFPPLSRAQSGNEMLKEAYKIEKHGKSYEMQNEFADNILFEFSLLIGVIHVCLSLLRYARRNFANIGWVAFAIGGYLYFPIWLKVTSMVEFLRILSPEVAEKLGGQLLIGGIGLAVILALFQRKWKGLLEITQIVQVFGDILSYLRLYALALASSIMAHTANQFGAQIGLVVGSLVILAGHVVTLVMGTQSGVIHGLRLNFLEWYHYCFQGEGKLFNPLRKIRALQKNEE